jgi:hypothetical protein
MTETRIRWSDETPGDGIELAGSTGSVGTLDAAAFHIWRPPQYAPDGELVLTSDLPGLENRRSFGDDQDALDDLMDAQRTVRSFTRIARERAARTERRP